jgi:hypothetical protein
MFLKVINSYRKVIAICDEELIGKRFEEERFQLDVKENFFKEEKVSEEELVKIIQNMSREDATFNIIGEKSINTALKAGIISQEAVGKIKGIPFALVLI